MSRRGNMVCFNVSGCEGIDEQLKEWLEFKVSFCRLKDWLSREDHIDLPAGLS